MATLPTPTYRSFPADKLDKGSATGAGLDEGPGIGTDNGAGLDKRLAELEERRSKVKALQADLNERLVRDDAVDGTGMQETRQARRQATRPSTRQGQACAEAGRQQNRQRSRQIRRQATMQAMRQVTRRGTRQAGNEADKHRGC